MNDFTIRWESGSMTLCLDALLKRKNGKFLNTTKTNLNKILKLVYQFCSEEQVKSLLNYMRENGCSDIADSYEKKYGRLL